MGQRKIIDFHTKDGVLVWGVVWRYMKKQMQIEGLRLAIPARGKIILHSIFSLAHCTFV
jgi:hypothetical protein